LVGIWVWTRQRSYLKLALAGHAQRRATGDEHCRLWSGLEYLDDVRSRRQHVLEVVQNEQDLTFAQRVFQSVDQRQLSVITNAEGAADRNANAICLEERCEIDEYDPVRERSLRLRLELAVRLRV
jgi:hypothetical protein